jgi:DNA polymerase-1
MNPPSLPVQPTPAMEQPPIQVTPTEAIMETPLDIPTSDTTTIDASLDSITADNSAKADVSPDAPHHIGETVAANLGSFSASSSGMVPVYPSSASPSLGSPNHRTLHVHSGALSRMGAMKLPTTPFKTHFRIDASRLAKGLNLAESSPETTAVKPEAAEVKPASTPPAPSNARFHIPETFPSDTLRAAKFYRHQGITVFPLVPPKAGDKTQNGKRPALKGYKELTLDWADDKTLSDYWGCGNPYNLGGLVPPGMLVVDLDSKADQGKTAREFIAKNPQLQNALRVHTQGGVHLWLHCPDIPNLTKADSKPLRAPLSKAINESLNAELMLPGMQITLPPSRRETGYVYHWNCAGEALTLTWAEVVQIFRFTHEKSETPTYFQRLSELQNRHKGNLRTLDVIKLFKEIGKYGRSLEKSPPKHAVACPFSAEHSAPDEGAVGESSSTVVFERTDKNLPAFYCLHAHCRDRNLLDLIEWANQEHSGVVDNCCTEVWRPQIALPGEGRVASAFASETAQILAQTRKYFCYGTEISVLRPSHSNPARLLLTSLEARQAITYLERDISFGNWRKDAKGDKGDKDDKEFIVKSMARETADTLLASSQFGEALPTVRRLLEFPLPLLDQNGRLVMPQAGYDALHQTYLQPNAPTIEPMEAEAAKKFLSEDFLGDTDSGGFPWRDEQSRINALARLLTPLCRGLMGWAKAPLFVLLANQPRLGKDTFAMAVQILYTGEAEVGASLDSKSGDAEMRKRITSLLLKARWFIHFANMGGHLNFSALEAATDASLNWTDRILQHSRIATLPNEAEYSLSMNLGASLTRDLMARSVVIEMHLASEDPNQRHFKHANLLDWVKNNRGKILGALLALIHEWDRQGRPRAKSRFASFPKWAEIVGSIMEANGLGNPCKRQAHLNNEIGDSETNDMRQLFEMAHNSFGNTYVTKSELYQLLSAAGEDAPFGHFILTGEKESKADQTKFGKILQRFKDRELSGITLRIDERDKNRKKLAFVRKEGGGTLPSIHPPALGMVQTSQTLQTSPSHPQGLTPTQTPSLDGVGTPKANSSEGVHGAAMPLQVCNVCEVPAEPLYYKILKDEADTQELLHMLNEPGVHVGLDLETFGEKPDDALNPRRGKVRLIQLAIGDKIFLLDVLQNRDSTHAILDALKRCQLVGHNLAFDLAFLKHHYEFEANSVFCTMTASRVLHAGEDIPHDLGAVLLRNLGIELAKAHGSSDWSGNLTQAQVDYAVADVAYLADLQKTVQQKLDAAGLTKTADLEMECVLLAVEMQSNGMHVDSAGLKDMLDQAEADLAAAQGKINELAGEKINVNSPTQIVKCLSARGLATANSQEETLRGLKDELADRIVTAKVAGTLIKKCTELLGAIEEDGRIHASFNPMQAKTGRFSTSKPNLQSIPRGPMRAYFRARPGFKLVDADYSQIELRIAAAVTGEEKMLAAFRSGVDLHVQTAALVLNKAPEEVTLEERQMAKAVNFGLLYGQKPAGLVKYAACSYGVTMTESQARLIREAFFKAYPTLAAWQKTQNHAASNATEVRTALGRRRVLKQGVDDWWSRFTALMNSPIQGAAADGMKLALCSLRKRLPENCRIVNTVHDEILVECPEEITECVSQLVGQTMVEEMQRLFPDVPIIADAKTIESWHDK